MPESPHILALELSGPGGSVGLAAGRNWLGEEHLRKESRHSDDLMPAIDRLMRRHQVVRAQLSEVHVAVGPGGFTGLRLAVTTAKMLAHALEVRLVAVPTAEVIAANAQLGADSLAVVLALKHGHGWFTRFLCQEDRWAASDGGRLLPIDEIIDASQHGRILSHQPPASFIKACTANGIDLQDGTLSAKGCWQAGWTRSRNGQFTDPLAIVPEYARPPEAVRLWAERAREDKS